MLFRSVFALAGDLEDAKAADDRGDYETVLKLLRPLAEQGDAKAQFNLGVSYSKGKGVPQDDKEAVKWFRKAAALGDHASQNALGEMLLEARRKDSAE